MIDRPPRRPAVPIQLPIGSEQLQGPGRPRPHEGVVWEDEKLGANFTTNRIPADMLERPRNSAPS
jgi:hypothetical protein